MTTDLFVVPTFRPLFVLVIIAHNRRRIVHITEHPTGHVATTMGAMKPRPFERHRDRRGRTKT